MNRPPSTPAVFVFHQQGCPACADYLPRFQQLAAGAPYPIGFYDLASNDRGNDLINKLAPNVRGVPTTVVMTRSGKLKAHVGALGNAQIQRVLQSALR